MPLYLYVCPICQEEQEIERSMSEVEEPIACPKHKPVIAMRRRYTMPGVNWGGLAPSQGEVHPAIKAELERGHQRAYDRGVV